MHDAVEKKKKGLRLVARKSIMSKWRKLNSDDSDVPPSTEPEINESPSHILRLKLSEAVAADPSLDGVPLPTFFRYAIDYIEEHGLTTEGIYRLSPPKNRLDELERKANNREPLYFADVHDATGLIKRFLRQTPEPVLPVEFERIAESCQCGLAFATQLKPGAICTCGKVQEMKEALKLLEIERKTLFYYVFLHAQNVMTKEKENKMGLQALGLLLQTVLEMSRKLVCFSVHAIRAFDGRPVEGGCYLLEESFEIVK
ncbi:unnamed protein product [Caenorhabditis bovis]|uniref:Rho-GAP domain-containing protein n=1 Tax=Caenorhabditis bovis TaxID=2654633 RepID=A0A8S1F955_9PELO|nr:unnamed protein product [Caenorhabditis bovis]